MTLKLFKCNGILPLANADSNITGSCLLRTLYQFITTFQWKRMLQFLQFNRLIQLILKKFLKI